MFFYKPGVTLSHPGRCSNTVGHSTRHKTSWRRPRYCSADTNHPDHPPAGEGVWRCHVPFREGHSACADGPGPPSCGVRDFHALPDLLNVHARTPTRGTGTVPCHYCHPDTAGRPPPSPQDQGRNAGRQRHVPPSHSVLPTVFDHCTPRFKGERRLPRPYTHVHHPSLQL